MSTKNNPGLFDCYAKALPNEPMFTILARDSDFFKRVHSWAKRRQEAIECGDAPDSDRLMVGKAEECAWNGRRWRKANMGIWRVK